MNFDNLTIGEVITLEDMCGVSLSQIEESGSDGRVLRALVYIVAKRDGREMSIAEIDALPVSETNEILTSLMGETRPM